MTTRRRALIHLALCALALAALLPLGSGAALAQAPGYDPDAGAPGQSAEVTVTTGPDGVTIHITVEERTPGSEGTPGADGGGGDIPSCEASPVNAGHLSSDWISEGLEQNPGTYPWGVTCDDGSFGIAWVPTDGGVPGVEVGEPPLPPIDPAVVRAELFHVVPLPAIRIGANPAVGLVAVESWFWVDGYRGGTLAGAATLGRYHVEAEITAVRYRWSWGDGGSLTSRTPGRAFPARSEIRHRYERSSLGAGGSYPVRVAITWEARYREDGASWLPLDPVTTAHAGSYAVAQLQSVLTTSR